MPNESVALPVIATISGLMLLFGALIAVTAMRTRRMVPSPHLVGSLQVVGEWWTLLIVRNLLVGGQRYKDLLETLPGITTNLLAARLRAMQDFTRSIQNAQQAPYAVLWLTLAKQRSHLDDAGALAAGIAALDTAQWPGPVLRFLNGERTGLDSAKTDLDEAWEIAERGPLPLHLADIHLHRARKN